MVPERFVRSEMEYEERRWKARRVESGTGSEMTYLLVWL